MYKLHFLPRDATHKRGLYRHAVSVRPLLASCPAANTFKLAMVVFKCLHGLAPSYLADDCVLASAATGRRHLRSADTVKLLVQRTRTVIGAGDFAVSAAAIWNSLPAALRLSSCSVQTFALKLKTFYASATM